MLIWTWEMSGASTRCDRDILEALTAGMGQWSGQPIACSRSQIQRLIQEGLVRVNGSVAISSSKLKTGDRIEIRFPPPRTSEILPEDRAISVLYQDEHLLVVNKPPNLTVHPSSTQTEGTLVNALLHHVTDLSGIGGVMRPGIVHRIDKDTSGALVITKTDAAHRKLVETFAEHSIERVYWALCYGSPKAASGKIESRIGRNPKDRKKMAMDVKEGRQAVTHYRRIEAYGVPGAHPFASWIEARLETGRTHQVRVHLTGLGHSILNDPVYGTPTERQTKWIALPTEIRECAQALPGQALHARTLGFNHPITGEKLHFEAPLPKEFDLLFQALQKYR